MLHFISQSSNTRKIENFFKHHHQEDDKNHLKTHKNLRKNVGGRRIAVAICYYIIRKMNLKIKKFSKLA